MTSQTSTTKNINHTPRLWIIYALLAVIFVSIIVVRVFLYEINSTPSGSMIPTVNPGDLTLVDKMVYRNLASDEKENTRPARGELITFRPPHLPKVIFLSRVIGIPGDVIKLTGKQLTINGKPIETKAIDGITFFENLNGISHMVRYESDRSPYRVFYGTVPANHYFVMSDNRDNSLDSREWGFLPAENIIGKVVKIWHQ